MYISYTENKTLPYHKASGRSIKTNDMLCWDDEPGIGPTGNTVENIVSTISFNTQQYRCCAWITTANCHRHWYLRIDFNTNQPTLEFLSVVDASWWTWRDVRYSLYPSIASYKQRTITSWTCEQFESLTNQTIWLIGLYTAAAAASASRTGRRFTQCHRNHQLLFCLEWPTCCVVT